MDILDEGPFYGPFLVQLMCMRPPLVIHISVYTYIGLGYPHTHTHCFSNMQHSTSGMCQTPQCHITHG